MFRVVNKYLIVGIYLFVFSVLRVWARSEIFGNQELMISEGVDLLLFFAGFGLGWMLLWVDHLIYCYTYPHELTSTRVAELYKTKRFKDIYHLLNDTVQERIKLLLHGILFQALFAVFSFWVITSSGSELGMGIVLGLMLNMLIWDWQRFKFGDFGRIFWQVKREVTRDEAKIVFIVISILFGWITVMATL